MITILTKRHPTKKYSRTKVKWCISMSARWQLRVSSLSSYALDSSFSWEWLVDIVYCMIVPSNKVYDYTLAKGWLLPMLEIPFDPIYYHRHGLTFFLRYGSNRNRGNAHNHTWSRLRSRSVFYIYWLHNYSILTWNLFHSQPLILTIRI